MAQERPTHSVPVEKFELEGDIEFDDWISLFENACRAATHAQGEEKEKKVFLEWLPLKMDTAALQLYNSKKELTYPDIKKELSELFTDPHEAYRWKSDPKAYQWDGKESLNAVAAKVIRKVKKNERSLTGNAQDEACFFRFRMAMPAKFRKAIDLGTAKDRRKIGDALDIALRVQISERDEDPPTKHVGWVAAATSESPVMADRMKALELGFASLSTKIEGMVKRDDDREKPRNRSDGLGWYRSPSDTRRGNDSNSHERTRDDREKRFIKRRDDRREDRFSSDSRSRDRQSGGRRDNRNMRDSRDRQNSWGRNARDGGDRQDRWRRDSREGPSRWTDRRSGQQMEGREGRSRWTDRRSGPQTDRREGDGGDRNPSRPSERQLNRGDRRPIEDSVQGETAKRGERKAIEDRFQSARIPTADEGSEVEENSDLEDFLALREAKRARRTKLGN